MIILNRNFKYGNVLNTLTSLFYSISHRTLKMLINEYLRQINPKNTLERFLNKLVGHSEFIKGLETLLTIECHMLDLFSFMAALI